MDSIIKSYLSKHLIINIDGRALLPKYLGYEKEDDAIFCYQQIDSVQHVKNIDIIDDLLFEFKPQQTNLVHVTVKGLRQSARLNNPESRVTFNFQ